RALLDLLVLALALRTFHSAWRHSTTSIGGVLQFRIHQRHEGTFGVAPARQRRGAPDRRARETVSYTRVAHPLERASEGANVRWPANVTRACGTRRSAPSSVSMPLTRDQFATEMARSTVEAAGVPPTRGSASRPGAITVTRRAPSARSCRVSDALTATVRSARASTACAAAPATRM